MMAKAVTEARRPDATAGTDPIYRSLFDSFGPDQDGRISPVEVLGRLERCGLQPDDPMSDAEGNGHTESAALLRQHPGQPGPRHPGEREAAAV